jgi:hypothetical protein
MPRHTSIPALCSLLFALCSLLFALCSLLFALCSLLFALCSLLTLPNAQHLSWDQKHLRREILKTPSAKWRPARRSPRIGGQGCPQKDAKKPLIPKAQRLCFCNAARQRSDWRLTTYMLSIITSESRWSLCYAEIQWLSSPAMEHFMEHFTANALERGRTNQTVTGPASNSSTGATRSMLAACSIVPASHRS